MAQVTILRRERGIDPTDPEGLKPALLVTYGTATRPPETVIVPGESPTEEEIAEAIRQDLAGREDQPPSTMEV